MSRGYRWVEHGLVFTTCTDSLLVLETVRDTNTTPLHEAGLPRLTFHEPRHIAACMLATQGVGQRTAADILRHSPRMVAEVYTHSPDSQRQTAVDALTALLEGAS